MPLSVAIIAQDEEDRISDCLKSVSFADEVLVVYSNICLGNGNDGGI